MKRVISVLCCILMLVTLLPVSAVVSADSQSAFTILCNNILSTDVYETAYNKEDHAVRFANLMSYYGQMSPDILALQECDEGWHNYLDAASGLPSLGYAAVNCTNVTLSGNQNPIYYKSDKFDVIASGYQHFADPDDTEDTMWGYTWAVFTSKEDGSQFAVSSAHLVAGGTDNNALRMEQTRQLIAGMNSVELTYEVPAVNMGDYNNNLNSYVYAELCAAYSSARDTAAEKVNMNYQTDCGGFDNAPDPVTDGTGIIDHCLHNANGIVSLRYEVLITRDAYRYSDHAPQLFTFAVDNAEKPFINTHSGVVDHCACGAVSFDGENWTGGAMGIGNHAGCTAVTGEWSDLNSYYNANKGSAGTTNVTLPGGNYYLSGDLTLTSELRATANATITLCLNGHTVSGDGKKVVYIDKACTVNICDCQGDGIATSTCTAQGAVIFAEKANTTLNLYSGTIVGSNACTVAGGAVRMNGVNASDAFSAINLYNMVIKDGVVSGTGTTKMGGNVVVNNCQLNMYGGIIQNGTAPVVGSNITLMNSAKFNMYGGAVIGGNNAPSIGIYNNSAAAAIQVYGGFLQLNQDLDTTAAATKMAINASANTYGVPVVIDLNGKTLSGAVNAGNGKLFIADSTAQIAGAGTGKLEAAVTGSLAQGQLLPAAAGEMAGQRYLVIDGVAHRFYIGIDNISLEKADDGSVGMGYSTVIKADAQVAALLTGDKAFGIVVGLSDGNGGMTEASRKEFGKAASEFVAGEAGNALTLRINSILSMGNAANAANAATGVRAMTFIQLQGYGMLYSSPYEFSLLDVLNAMNEKAAQLPVNAAQLLVYVKQAYGLPADDSVSEPTVNLDMGFLGAENAEQ